MTKLAIESGAKDNKLITSLSNLKQNYVFFGPAFTLY